MPGAGPVSHAPYPDLAFTGGCEVSLERAVVPYRSLDDRSVSGGRSADLGVGVVLDGPKAGRAEILDLGSGEVREAELGAPVVVFGWIFTTPFRELTSWLGVRRSGAGVPFAARILSQIGFTPLSRPIFLRAGFRDITLDLDPHEGTAVRMCLPSGGVARAHMDYDRGFLVFRTGSSVPDPSLAAGLPDAFPGRPLFRVTGGAGQGTVEFHVQLPELSGLRDLHAELRRVRRGLLHLFARFDEARYRAVLDARTGFGERDFVAHLLAGDAPSAAAAPTIATTRERLRVPRAQRADMHQVGRVH